jgi:hypothetical protein
MRTTLPSFNMSANSLGEMRTFAFMEFSSEETALPLLNSPMKQSARG